MIPDDDPSLVLRAWQALLAGTPEKIDRGLRDGRSNDAVLDDGAWQRIGGHLVDERGRWRRLGDLRGRLLAWEVHVPDRNAWLALVAGEDLLGPEEREAPQGNRQVLRNRALKRIAAELEPAPAPRTPPGSDYYWPREVKRGEEAPGLARQEGFPRHRFEDRVMQLIAKGEWRIEFCSGFERYLVRQRIGLHGYAESRERVASFCAGFRVREPRPLAMVFRAYKKAVYQRTARYLDLHHPAWRPRARAETGLRVIGLEPDSGEGLAGHPLAREWLWYHPRWVEPVGVDLHQNEHERRVSAAIPDQRQQPPKRRLGALLELSFADLLTPGRRIEVYDHLVDQILTESLEDTIAPPPGYASYGRVLVKARKVNQAAPVAPAVPAAAPDSALRDRHRTDGFRDDLAVYRASGADTPPPWMLDHQHLHDTVAALVRTRDLGDEKRDLARMLLQLAAQGALHPQDVKGVFGTLNYLSVHMISTGIAFPGNFTGALTALAQTGSTPFVGALYRCLALQESKRHRYGPAKAWLDTGRDYLDRWRGSWSVAEADAVGFAEANQQVWLAAGGTELRLLEFHLANPYFGTSRLAPDRLIPLARQGRRALHAVGEGVGTLESLTREHGLPASKRYDRASTVTWKIAAQIMFVRALLLQATVDAVRLDAYRDAGERTADHEEMERSVDMLVRAAKIEYQMLTENRLARSHMLTLTQLAMHYAFLNGMRFLKPGGNPANLAIMPSFLKRAVENEFDVNAATGFLIAKEWNAGILASLTSPQIIETLGRRSLRGGPDPQRVDTSPYCMWRRNYREEQALARDFTIGRTLRRA
ncbi:hypothetical protein [Glycomyces tritici]|uniref:Uncharacterized protein n=1 Tax=Glycomyces tritici TaxID=2665176 RepID=A0ABT7YIQ7_9ACTN|nr:hypothetical protein [Glycomyces tritici]MDN3238505.1 hypothetical protein [Glycomyces tritici]